jgi:wyosine [tRNA(Phe)-imidazoG37] synthetase (radical SAM superfamily)/flavodoxin
MSSKKSSLSDLALPAGLFVLCIALWQLEGYRKKHLLNYTRVSGQAQPAQVQILIIYSTVTSTAKNFALKLGESISKQRDSNNVDSNFMFDCRVVDVADFNEDELEKSPYVLYLSSTCAEGTSPKSGQYFMDWLVDMANDFRISKDHMAKVCYAGFGLGSLVYGEENYCTPIKKFHECMAEMGGRSLLALEEEGGAGGMAEALRHCMGDDQTDLEAQFNKWSVRVIRKLRERWLFYSHAAPVQASSSGVAVAATASKRNVAAPALTDLERSKLTLEDVEKLPYSSKNKRLLKELRKKEEAKIKGEVVEDGPEQVPVKTKRPKFQVVQGQKKSKLQAKSASDVAAGGCCGGGEGSGGCCKTEGAAEKKQDSGCCGGGSSCGSKGKGKSGVNPNLLGLMDDEEEEDRINDAFVTMDMAGAGSDSDEEGCGGAAQHTDDGLVDLEDLGTSINASLAGAVESDGYVEPEVGTGAAGKAPKKVHEMVTNLQRKALTKEGYRIIGTHSAVKMCRWTKNQMRGRGGCYKHSFYGITSYQCMEATPSLACANKCVFCWRHHKNPVGTEWRWKEDDPAMIVEEAVGLHQTMVNEMRGVPGVLQDRLEEAFTPRHCALSLVGEPIMYPKINEMVKELHDRRISTFLVTNGQFPEMVEALDPVTQLYVSIDAASKSSLKAIDRPLFKDYWERYLDSLRHLSRKSQRTVYRMTLVKSWNMDEAEQYAELIEYGTPDFIEIKSVTYCGKSDASSLTMENVPWHTEVCEYAEAIVNQLNKRRQSGAGNSYSVQARDGGAASAGGARKTSPVYGIATEHQHSCCVLIAREDKFKVAGDWHTWIDYNKFDELIADYYSKVAILKAQLRAGGSEDVYRKEMQALDQGLQATDYMRKTPSWALYNSSERGFDPSENRFRRNKQGVLVENEYKATDSGCG